ncbi:MAG: hypothetical protein WC852_06850 [Candidatus Nanoarchaeia archaeon]|jgi:hypothetical protein
MKTRNILALGAAVGLAALAGGCKEVPKQFFRQDWSNGCYSIIEEGNNRIFDINCINGDELTDRRNDMDGMWYIDRNRDGQVDEIGKIGFPDYTWKKRSRGPEYLFLKADEYFAQTKEDMGIQ